MREKEGRASVWGRDNPQQKGNPFQKKVNLIHKWVEEVEGENRVKWGGGGPCQSRIGGEMVNGSFNRVQ